MKKVRFEVLHQFMVDVLMKCDVPKKHADICADILLESDKRGIDSHGVNRFKAIYIDRIKRGILHPVTNLEIIKDFKATAVIDGHDGMGMVISKKAMDIAIEKAKEYGIGMVSVRNSSHYGIAGYYATMATDEDLIGLTGTNARPSVAPTFGVENMLGTNPLTVGFPSNDEFPYVLDAATSIIQRGKIEFYAKNNVDTPKGMVIDRDGEDVTDSKEILKMLKSGDAALNPLGGKGEELAGYKGYGYATIVEVLSSALQMGNYMKQVTEIDEKGQSRPYSLGHFFIAIDPEAFMGKEAFKRIVSEIMNELRNSKKAKGEKRIYTAGEKEYLARIERKDGLVLNDALKHEFNQLAKEFGLDYEF
ncbi:MAG: Ldh family oxidoreductase [Candidatus Izemoplasmataceae bacterium]